MKAWDKLKVGLLWIGLCSVLSPAAQADELPTAPQLRIEVGDHTGIVYRISADRDARYLLTVSNDKTARVWDAASGRLLNTLRPPVGNGNEGKIYGGALSPDGAIVALAGGGSYALSFYERASGRMLRTVGKELPVANHVEFSPDGKRVALTLHKNSSAAGVRLVDVATGKYVGEDNAYDAASYYAAFSPDGRRMVTTSEDGVVRQYEVSADGLRLLHKRKLTAGVDPFAARYSPDGTRIAVGYNETAQVSLLDASDLSVLPGPDMSGVQNSISAVSWSPDRDYLWAAGKWSRNDLKFFRRWNQRGSGSPQDFQGGAKFLVMDLLGLPKGRLAFVASGGVWGMLQNDGASLAYLKTGPMADFRNQNDALKLSADGKVVQFGFGYGGADSVTFDAAQGAFVQTPPVLYGPRTSAPGMELKSWEDKENPTLNGQPLKTKRAEQWRSRAFAPDGMGFVAGASWTLRAFDRYGSLRWEHTTPGAVWAVNISADGKVVVAAMGDGTLNWYRYADGKPLLTLFPHTDHKRWVLWTPSGYFAASPGAEDMIGWNLNRGYDNAADFFPASRFRDRFFRPDVIEALLDTHDEALALQKADAGRGGRVTQTVSVAQVLPPVVEILSPADGSTQSGDKVTVRYRVRTPGDAPLTGVRVRVNGQAQNATRGLKSAAGDVREVEVNLLGAENDVMLFAENRNGVSAPAVLRLLQKDSGKREDFGVRPKLYVLAIGVSKYKLKDLQLEFAAKDATDFANALRTQKGKLYRDVEVKLLTDADASKDEVLDALDWLRAQVTAKDLGMVFLAGHGVNDPDGSYYYLPQNADPDRLKRTAVAFHDIKSTLSALPGKAVFFVDTCHSGNVLGTGRRAVADIGSVVNELSSAENGVLVFSSSTGRQYSLENPAWGNGAFTKAVVEGLTGKADITQSGRITHKALDFYIAERVKALTGGKQSPVTIIPQGVPDFPIAITR